MSLTMEFQSQKLTEIDGYFSGFDRYIDKLGLPNESCVVPSATADRRCYWLGSTTRDGEQPVLSLVDYPQEIRIRTDSWHFGIIRNVEVFDENKDNVCLEAAQYIAPNLEFALNGLLVFTGRDIFPWDCD